MTDLLSELEALKETLEVMAKYAPAPGVLCAPTMEMGLGWKAKGLLAKIDTHHAEIAAAVRKAALFDLVEQRAEKAVGADGVRFELRFDPLVVRDGSLREYLDAAMRAGEGEG